MNWALGEPSEPYSPCVLPGFEYGGFADNSCPFPDDNTIPQGVVLSANVVAASPLRPYVQWSENNEPRWHDNFGREQMMVLNSVPVVTAHHHHLGRFGVDVEHCATSCHDIAAFPARPLGYASSISVDRTSSLISSDTYLASGPARQGIAKPAGTLSHQFCHPAQFCPVTNAPHARDLEDFESFAAQLLEPEDALSPRGSADEAEMLPISDMSYIDSPRPIPEHATTRAGRLVRTPKHILPAVAATKKVSSLRPRSTAVKHKLNESADDFKDRSSRFRGVTRHRRSGRWEAHIWVKEIGRQVYLGGYEHEEHAAEAYDVAALKCKGLEVKTNFAVTRYDDLLPCMDTISLDELIMAVRRQSQGFSRGSSSFRGVTAHPSGRWESRIGIPGSRHVYLGLYEDESDAARAYDRALVRLRGTAAATNFLLANYRRELSEYHQLQQVMLVKANLADFHASTEFEVWIKSGPSAATKLERGGQDDPAASSDSTTNSSRQAARRKGTEGSDPRRGSAQAACGAAGEEVGAEGEVPGAEMHFQP